MSYRYERESIKRFGKIFDRRKNGAELVFPCPKCNDIRKSNKLYVNTETGLFHCFRCGYKGKLSKTYELSDVFSNTIRNDKNRDTQEYLIEFNKKELTEEQRNALYKRGLTDEEINYYNFSGGGKNGRIEIPNKIIGNFTNMICAWEWRKENVNKTYNPKYLYPNVLQTNNVLFNIHNISINCNNITLCEGVFNAITVGKTAVASYGCDLSDRQLQLLLEKQPKSITIAYDSDDAGVKGSLKVIKKLNSNNYNGIVYYILLPKGIDINDMGRNDYINYLDKNKIIIDIHSQLSQKLPQLLYNVM